MWFFKLYWNLAHTPTLKAISLAPYDRNEGSSGSSRPSISPSEHLVGFNPSGSYPGSGNPYPGSSIDSPPMLASGRDLSTPRPSGISPYWHYLFPILGKRQDFVWKLPVCCHKHSNRHFQLTVSCTYPFPWICILCILSS